jgi:hypothetical protein
MTRSSNSNIHKCLRLCALVALVLLGPAAAVNADARWAIGWEATSQNFTISPSVPDGDDAIAFRDSYAQGFYYGCPIELGTPRLNVDPQARLVQIVVQHPHGGAFGGLSVRALPAGHRPHRRIRTARSGPMGIPSPAPRPVVERPPIQRRSRTRLHRPRCRRAGRIAGARAPPAGDSSPRLTMTQPHGCHRRRALLPTTRPHTFSGRTI